MTCQFCERVALYRDAGGNGVCAGHRVAAVASWALDVMARDDAQRRFRLARRAEREVLKYERRKKRGGEALAATGSTTEVGQSGRRGQRCI